jgi:putative flippase GtrA
MRHLLRFSLVGIVNTAIGLICIWSTMYFLALNEVAANLCGYVVALGVSFALNRTWTFGHSGPVAASLPRWLGLAALAYVANLAIVVTAHRLFGIDAYLAQPLGICGYTLTMFLGAKFLVFRDPA